MEVEVTEVITEADTTVVTTAADIEVVLVMVG
jgi:hypothetical protein